MKIGIIGLGFVGGSMLKSFTEKNVTDVIGYDKYKQIGSLEECLNCDVLFLALPTLYDDENQEYDKNPIYETCEILEKNNFDGVVVIKSTVEPETTEKLAKSYKLNFVHNPEFLTARTAYEDFHNQKHIVLGKADSCNENKYKSVVDFYSTFYPYAEISLCSSTESESMKIFANCYYAVKIQFFNELHSLCQKTNSNYNTIKELMIKNGWINSMHTDVPGPDGKPSYGGLCFPKDTNALCKFMNDKNSPHLILDACIKERNMMREDHDNCILKNE